MNLVDKKKLEEKFFKWDTSNIVPGGESFRRQIYGLIDSCLVSPAELVEENLKALAVLEKVKDYLEGKVNPPLVGIRNLIRNLKFDISKPNPKGREKEMKLYKRKRFRTSKPEFDRWASVYKEVSPANLAGILKGKAWVLETVKERLKRKKSHPDSDEDVGWRMAEDFIYDEIVTLESQVPIDEIEKKIKENERKAEAWEKLKVALQRKGVLGWDPRTSKGILGTMDELLAQSKEERESETR